MPRYHFVVRAHDRTHDELDRMHFPNHEAAREHGHRIVPELREGGYNPENAGSYTTKRNKRSIRSRFEQLRLAPPLLLCLPLHR
jgi:hypothetical protein